MSTATMARTATLTDEQIQRDVSFLRGTVRAWAEREEAEGAAWAAWAAPGITTVENLITMFA
jgi:osmotically-inducible protein OsmY